MPMPSSSSCIDTLRLSHAERRDLLDRLEREADAQKYLEMRGDQRINFERRSGVVMKLYHPGGSSINYLIRPRNISRTGIAFLHGNYVHIDSRCGLLLKTVHGQAKLIHGKVVWCRHVVHRVHEVGAQFEDPIVLSAFVDSLVRADMVDGDDASHELPSLHGRLLYVEDSVDDRDLLQFHMSQLGVQLDTLPDAVEAIGHLQNQPADLTLANVCLPGMTGLEMTQMLRAEGYNRPIVLLTANPNRPSDEEARAVGVTAVLHKPYTFEQLLATLRDHLPAAAADDAPPPEPVLSEHWGNVRMRPLILNFLSRLDNQLGQLRQCVEGPAGDPVLEKMCLDLRGSAGGYGFPQISEAAERLYQHAADGTNLEELQRDFTQLETLCRSACDTAATTPVPPPAGRERS
ncbi:MAG: response regulator [Phycisphaeraceae bacterium]